MKKRDILKLNRTVGLFNYEGIKLDLVIKMSKTKTALNEAVEKINKETKELFTSLKPVELDRLQEELKNELAKETFDKEKINILQLRVEILFREFNEKYQEAEGELLSEEGDEVKIEKITEEEFSSLMKPRRELMEMEQGKREVVITNHFKTEDVSSLSLLLKEK